MFGVALSSSYYTLPSSSKRFSLSPLFSYVSPFSVTTTSLSLKTANVSVAVLQAKQDNGTLSSPQVFKFYFSYWIFHKVRLIFSYDSFVLTVLVVGTDGDSFTVCRSAGFKLSFSESINERQIGCIALV